MPGGLVLATSSDYCYNIKMIVHKPTASDNDGLSKVFCTTRPPSTTTKDVSEIIQPDNTHVSPTRVFQVAQ